MLSENFNQNQPLHFNTVIAHQSGYQLKEKHVVVYLHNWSILNGTIKSDGECANIVNQLVQEFNISPASTTIKLERYAKIHFKKISNVLSSVLMHQEDVVVFSQN